jgi:hypothetical protein
MKAGVIVRRNEDCFRVFGHICVFFATLDFFVSIVVMRVVRLGTKLPDLSSATLGQKLRFLSDLKPENTVNEAVLAQIQDALPEAIEVGKTRNRFIHDLWKFAPEAVEDGFIERSSLAFNESAFARTIDISSERYSLNDLYGFLEQVGEQQKFFASFWRVFHSPSNRSRLAGTARSLCFPQLFPRLH